jgi:EEF1A N-terminal glycine/lysine methyltransferase
VCITDHPSSPALSSGAIEANAHESLELAKRRKSRPEVSINPYEWGSVTDAFAQENCNHFTKIVATDCLWIPSQHRNLAHSIAHFLSKETPDACALIVAGFHTGRHIVADFFRQFPTSGGSGDTLEKLSIAEIYEIDMHGVRRHWLEYRPNEAKEEANKWCVVAVVVRG